MSFTIASSSSEAAPMLSQSSVCSGDKGVPLSSSVFMRVTDKGLRISWDMTAMNLKHCQLGATDLVLASSEAVASLALASALSVAFLPQG